jgi:hypothetical protein
MNLIPSPEKDRSRSPGSCAATGREMRHAATRDAASAALRAPARIRERINLSRPDGHEWDARTAGDATSTANLRSADRLPEVAI